MCRRRRGRGRAPGCRPEKFRPLSELSPNALDRKAHRQARRALVTLLHHSWTNTCQRRTSESSRVAYATQERDGAGRDGTPPVGRQHCRDGDNRRQLRRLSPCGSRGRRGPSTTATRSVAGSTQSGVTFSPANPAWKSPVLDGQVYGEPLEATGRVYVATENDTVYALAANTGAIAVVHPRGDPGTCRTLRLCPAATSHPRSASPAHPSSTLARDEIFAVADEFNGSSSTHVLVGLNLYTGNTMLDSPVDPPGQGSAAILQRTGLNLSNGNVVFGYGGNDGDCSTYTAGSSRRPRAAGRRLTSTPRAPQRGQRGGLDGRCRARGRSVREHLGGHGQRVVLQSLRRQRLGPRAVPRPEPGAAVRPEYVVLGQRR